MNRLYIQSNQLKKQQEPMREKDPVHFRSLMLILLTCSLVVIGVFSYIWRGVEILRMGYQMRAVYHQRSLLKEQRQKLMLEDSALRSLRRIEHIATSQLRLVKPNQDQIIILRPASKAEGKDEQHHNVSK